ncbi:ShlB/FhaC/HecB family hemolysin secretion/activation protein [Synoicihabitans lomoniglobus]|uniref:ShlB/FhaC/HecB family hemolysin secretion/activation protein n=2 Tax=Synoicihabitans lomoniglobus TaxID=2909285 RepID=A0AAF0CGC4_9BACT|nr:ShlB/FhaC/HecB family hemolysin secretion/activation protein [Opitutaceae bacterium LMO-M01]
MNSMPTETSSCIAPAVDQPTRRKLVILVSALAGFGLPVAAQNLNEVMPQPVPSLVEPAADPMATSIGANASVDPAAGFLAQPGEAIIIDELKGVRVIADPSRLESASAARVDPIQIDGVPSLDHRSGHELLQLVLGRPASMESLNRLRDAIRLLLAQSGRAFSSVILPPQDITEGYLQIVVIESVVGEVRVEGSKHFSAQSYLSRLEQKTGEAVDGRALTAGIDRINQNSFRSAATRVEAGARPGTTDIVIQVKERFPWRFFTGYSNTGTQTTTEDRINAGVNWGNAFGRGHLATLQWTSDLKAKHSRALSANYTADLPHNHSLTFFGAYSEIESVPNGGLSQEGVSWQAGLNYDLPLPDYGKHYVQSLQFGADFKVSDNNLEFAVPPFVIPISDNLTHIAQIRASYRGTFTDKWGATSWGVKLTAAPGGLSSANDDEAFNGSRAMAQSSYVYGSVDVFREFNLDALLSGAKWTMRGEFQMSAGNLLGSEQFSAGGSGSVRGYEQGEVVGDNALFFSQEWHLPPFSVAKSLLKLEVRDALRLFAFHDYARVWNVDKLEGERPFSLHSVGVGLRYQLTQHGSLQASHGWQLRDSGSSDTGDNSRLHLSANLSF